MMGSLEDSRGGPHLDNLFRKQNFRKKNAKNINFVFLNFFVVLF